MRLLMRKHAVWHQNLHLANTIMHNLCAKRITSMTYKRERTWGVKWNDTLSKIICIFFLPPSVGGSAQLSYECQHTYSTSLHVMSYFFFPFYITLLRTRLLRDLNVNFKHSVTPIKGKLPCSSTELWEVELNLLNSRNMYTERYKTRARIANAAYRWHCCHFNEHQLGLTDYWFV